MLLKKEESSSGYSLVGFIIIITFVGIYSKRAKSSSGSSLVAFIIIITF